MQGITLLEYSIDGVWQSMKEITTIIRTMSLTVDQGEDQQLVLKNTYRLVYISIYLNIKTISEM